MTTKSIKKQKVSDDIALPTAEQLQLRLAGDRLKRGLSWQAYAKLLGVSLTTLNRVGRGVVSPHDTTIYKLVRKLDQLPAVR